jgi:hypothetical protein
MVEGLLIGSLAGITLALAVSLTHTARVYRSAYALGVKHGREMEVEAQWGADVRELLAHTTTSAP